MTLPELLTAVATGAHLPDDGSVDVLAPTRPGESAVLALTGRNVIVADVEPEWVRGLLPADDLSAPLCPPFLTALGARLRRQVGNIDMATVAPPSDAAVPADLMAITERHHPRVQRALRYREDVRVWAVPGGTLVLGRGLGGRCEVAVEVDPAYRGRGLGRMLAHAARSLSPEPVWAQIAPGNAASVRAFLVAGYRPVGAESLLS